MKQTIIGISVHAENDNPIFGDSVTHVLLDDEVGGFFVKLSQEFNDGEPNTIRLDFDEVDTIVDAINTLKKQVQ